MPVWSLLLIFWVSEVINLKNEGISTSIPLIVTLSGSFLLFSMDVLTSLLACLISLWVKVMLPPAACGIDVFLFWSIICSSIIGSVLFVGLTVSLSVVALTAPELRTIIRLKSNNKENLLFRLILPLPC